MSSPRSPASATRSQATAPTESAPDNDHAHGAEPASAAATATSSSSEATGGEAAGIAITPGESNAGIDVIVVDDTSTTPVAPSASPSRSSSRIASRVPTARTKSKRGPTASSVAAGKKKRKAVKATAGTAKVGPSAQHAGTPSAGAAANMSSSLPESETETPAFAHRPVATAPAPKRASTGERTPRRSIVWLGDDYSAAAGVSTSSAAAGASTSSAATTSAAIPAPAGPTGVPDSVPAAPAAFCLDTFMERFSDRLAAPIAQPQLSGPLHSPASAPTHELSMETKLDRLFAMLHELKEQVNASTGPAPIALPTPPTLRDVAGDVGVGGTFGSGSGPAGVTTAWTLPPCGHPADMPPAAIQHLQCASFPAPRSRAKGEYYPPQAHQLAAHRLYKTLSSEDGAYTTPMSFVLQLRELECARFEVTPPVLMALYSARLGNRGLTVMHFRPLTEMEQLRRGSTNANFAMDFGAGAVLPATTPQCATYEDLLAAISGLTSFGDALFYDHVRRLTSRLKRFVLANMERDTNTPERVTLTLMYVNSYLGRAMGHLVEDSPEWWRNYCEAVRAVDYHAADWQAALNGLALRLAARTSAPEASARQPQRNTNAPAPRRAPAGRVPIMPEHVRRQIPRDADGREPCLRYFSGGMCYGGSAERCAHARRTHHWDRRLPRDVQDFIDRHYGPGPGPRAAARQDIRPDSRNDGSADSRRGRP